MRISNGEHVHLKWRTCVSQIGFQGFKLLSDVSFQQEESGGLRGATPCAKDALTRFINRQISTTAHAALGMTGCRGGGLRGATPLRHAKKKGANLAPFNNMLGLVLRNEFF